MSAVSRTVQIDNKRGLHARASAKFVTLASQLPAAVEVAKDGNKVCGTSIMGLMMLSAGIGSRITVWATGPQAAAAMDALTTLLANRFGEED